MVYPLFSQYMPICMIYPGYPPGRPTCIGCPFYLYSMPTPSGAAYLYSMPTLPKGLPQGLCTRFSIFLPRFKLSRQESSTVYNVDVLYFTCCVLHNSFPVPPDVPRDLPFFGGVDRDVDLLLDSVEEHFIPGLQTIVLQSILDKHNNNIVELVKSYC